MKRIGLAICLWTAVLCSAWAADAADTREVVKVGVLLPLSGQMAAYGEPVQNGMLMRLEELAEQDTHYRYEFIFEDTQGTVKGGTMAAHKLVDRDKVDFLISLWGFMTHPILPIVERKKIPTLVMLTWRDDITQSAMVMSLASSPKKQARLMAKAFKKLGYKTVSIVRLRDFEVDYASPIVQSIFEEEGIEVLDEQIVNMAMLDVSSVVMKLKQKNPDVIINLTYDALLYRLERKFNELAREIPLANFESYDGVLDFDLVQGRWYVTVAQASGEFAKRYQQRWGQGVGYGSGFAYDAAGLVMSAFEEGYSNEGGLPSAQKVAGFFSELNGRLGVVGELTSDENGSIDTQPQLMRIENGKAVEIGLDEL